MLPRNDAYKMHIPLERELIITADGSHSIYVKELDEHYHSVHGAIQEAQHVFLKMGIHFLTDKNYKELSILEIGFGTGLNALLTLLEAEKLNIKINYSSLEAFPLTKEMTNQLNYVDQVSAIEKQSKELISKIFNKLHDVSWEEQNIITDHFKLQKIKNTLQAIEFETNFDLIFFDAFGPRVQPEMWTEELFSKINKTINPGGCLVTYCAKGEVKRALKRSGFEVETLPGPPRKREMIRANKN